MLRVIIFKIKLKFSTISPKFLVDDIAESFAQSRTQAFYYLQYPVFINVRECKY